MSSNAEEVPSSSMGGPYPPMIRSGLAELVLVVLGGECQCTHAIVVHALRRYEAYAGRGRLVFERL